MQELAIEFPLPGIEARSAAGQRPTAPRALPVGAALAKGAA